MSAGTLKLTNNSTAVVGTSTLFTTDLKAGDFIVMTIGGVLYTLPVDTVTSNTAATLVSPFTGPTTTGAAWTAVPRKTMNQVTAELVNQSTAAIRALLAEKGNWMNFYTAPGDISIQPGDSAPAVSGPGWKKMAGMVASALQTQPGYYDGDLNTLLTPGVWSVTAAATNGPVSPGQAGVATGICEVIPRSSANSLLQRYTNITIGAANINRTWQRTLSGSTWSPWELLGTKPLNDLGLGLNALASQSSIDMQQFDFLTGASYYCPFANVSGLPSEISYPDGTAVTIAVDYASSSGTRVGITITPNTGVNTAYKVFHVLIVGAKGSRTFNVRQDFTSADVVPLVNGGTGATTAAAARAALGVSYGAAAGSVAQGNDARLNSLEGKSGGTVTGQIKDLPSTGQGETKTAPYNAPITHGGALPLFAHGHSVTIQKNGGVGSQFTLGFSFGGYIGSAGTADSSGPMLTCSDGISYTKYWNFVNGSGGINTANGGILPSGSDARLKRNITDAKFGALQRILSIVRREFNWIGDGRRDRGYIAQQLREIDPLYVFEAGGDDPEQPILNVSHHALISDLAGAVEELHEQNTSLRQELDALKEKVEQLIAN